MAYWNGSSKNSDGSLSPPTQQLPSPHHEPLPPDTVDHVVDQAEDVVRNFMYQRYQQELMNPGREGETTPQVPELVNFTSDPLR